MSPTGPNPPESARGTAAQQTDAIPSFGALYDEYFAFVWRNLRRAGVPPQRLADAAQDAFLVVHRRLPEFQGRSPIRSWLYGIVVRVASSYRRSHRRKDVGDADDPDLIAAPAPSPSARAEQAEALRAVERILAGLPEEKREAFMLSELEQMTAPEIAEAIGVNVNTVSSRLRAAREEFDAAVARLRASNGGFR